jgi:hypothetical protein
VNPKVPAVSLFRSPAVTPFLVVVCAYVVAAVFLFYIVADAFVYLLPVCKFLIFIIQFESVVSS